MNKIEESELTKKIEEFTKSLPNNCQKKSKNSEKVEPRIYPQKNVGKMLKIQIQKKKTKSKQKLKGNME